MREDWRYWLDIISITSKHCSGSGTSLLDRGWTLFYAGFVPDESYRAGVASLIAPQLSANVLEFTPVYERVGSLCLWVGEWVLTVVCAK